MFHGCYDFAYLLRLLRNEELPRSPEDFYKAAKIYFPNIYDLKEIVREEEGLKNHGLSSIAEKIGVYLSSFSVRESALSIKQAVIVY